MNAQFNNQEILLSAKSGFGRNQSCEKQNENESSGTAPN